MKFLLGFVILAAQTNLMAFELKVKDMQMVPGMDAKIILTSEPKGPATLDCQSFIQGLALGSDFYYLWPDECEGLYLRIKNSLQSAQFHCLELEEVIRSDYTCLE